jgi:hypothetical protein
MAQTPQLTFVQFEVDGQLVLQGTSPEGSNNGANGLRFVQRLSRFRQLPLVGIAHWVGVQKV